MTLTTKQLAALRTDLTTLAQVDYDHLRDELLDHYATLTEETMAAGSSFFEAHTAAWQAMGGSEGLSTIQQRYERVTRAQLKARHQAILKHLFHWPTIVITLLVATLIVYLLMIMPMQAGRLVTGLLLISPIFVMIATAIPYYRQKDSRKKLVWRFITQRANLPIALINLMNVFDVLNPTIHEPSRLGVLCLMLMAGGSLCLTISLTQLMREHFSFSLT